METRPISKLTHMMFNMQYNSCIYVLEVDIIPVRNLWM